MDPQLGFRNYIVDYISRMLNISILVVCADFIWVSKNIALFSADVVIVQNCNGHFLGMKHIDSKLVDIGEVPQYIVNRRRSPYVKMSTRNDRGNEKEDMGELIDPGLSPILEQGRDLMKDDTGFSLSETNSSERMLREEVKQFEEGTIEDEEGSISGEVQDKKVSENVEKLDIRDMGKDTSSDISGNITDGNKVILMMPNSTQLIDIMTEDDNASTSHNKSVKDIEIDEKCPATTEVKNDSTMTEGAPDISKTVTPTEEDFISLNDTYLSNSDNKTENAEMKDGNDPNETIDCIKDEKKSEISDGNVSIVKDSKSKGVSMSEISDIKPKKAIKRLGSNGPVVVLKPLLKQEDYVVKIAEDEENVTYKSVSAV